MLKIAYRFRKNRSKYFSYLIVIHEKDNNFEHKKRTTRVLFFEIVSYLDMLLQYSLYFLYSRKPINTQSATFEIATTQVLTQDNKTIDVYSPFCN